MTTTFPPTWLRYLTADELERLAIRTADGTMTDEEAAKAEGVTRKLWERMAAERKEERQR